MQLAAGTFLNLKEEELEHSPQAAAGNDFTGISLLMLSNLMLAQAQECVLEKAVKGNMKPGVLSKLAAQVAEYYEVTNNLITTTELKNIVPKVKTNIMYFEYLQVLYFKLQVNIMYILFSRFGS